MTASRGVTVRAKQGTMAISVQLPPPPVIDLAILPGSHLDRVDVVACNGNVVRVFVGTPSEHPAPLPIPAGWDPVAQVRVPRWSAMVHDGSIGPPTRHPGQ